MVRHKALRSPRLARRARKRAARRIAFLACALALLLGAAFFLATLEIFSIREVTVLSASDDLRTAITELVRGELAGAYLSFIPKENAFAYPKRKIEQKILEHFPRVRSASARLLSPSRLGVEVREREGVALWCAESSPGGEDCFLVDASGVVFESAAAGASRSYHRIRAEAGEGTTVTPLGTSVLPEKRLTALLSFLRLLEELSLSPSRLTLLQGGDVAAEIAGGGRILARESADFFKQADNLRGLLAEKDLVPRSGETLRVDYIDLRYGNKLYFKPR